MLKLLKLIMKFCNKSEYYILEYIGNFHLFKHKRSKYFRVKKFICWPKSLTIHVRTPEIKTYIITPHGFHNEMQVVVDIKNIINSTCPELKANVLGLSDGESKDIKRSNINVCNDITDDYVLCISSKFELLIDSSGLNNNFQIIEYGMRYDKHVCRLQNFKLQKTYMISIPFSNYISRITKYHPLVGSIETNISIDFIELEDINMTPTKLKKCGWIKINKFFTTNDLLNNNEHIINGNYHYNFQIEFTEF